MFTNIPTIFLYFNGLIIITSVLFGITQYFDNIHGKFISDGKDIIKKINFPRSNKGIELERKLQDKWGNKEPISLRVLIATLYATLVIVAILFAGVNIISEDCVLCNGRIICFLISSWIILIGLSVLINLFSMWKERHEFKTDLRRAQDDCELIQDMMVF